MSRAKAALRQAKQTGDTDQVTAARDRLTTARAAHQDAKNAVAAHDTADQHGDVTDTPPPTTEDTSMGDQRDDHDHEPDGGDTGSTRRGFTIHNTNIATGNATVGSQHDVHGDTHTDDQADQAEHAAKLVRKAVKKAAKQAKRARRDDEQDTDRQSSANVASGGDVVGQQVGFQFGTTRVHHTGRGDDSADQGGDVTPRTGPTRIGGMTITGRVGNVVAGATGPITVNTVHGRNHGVQTDVVHGGIIINHPSRPGHGGDVTPPPTPREEFADGTRVFRTRRGTMRVGSDGHVEITRDDGETDFQGHVSDGVWLDGHRVR